MTILLSMLWHANHFWFGDGVTAGIECIVGSAIYFISTGISLEQMNVTMHEWKQIYIL
jgi:uncharacterized membrane protein YhhN